MPLPDKTTLSKPKLTWQDPVQRLIKKPSEPTVAEYYTVEDVIGPEPPEATPSTTAEGVKVYRGAEAEKHSTWKQYQSQKTYLEGLKKTQPELFKTEPVYEVDIEAQREAEQKFEEKKKEFEELWEKDPEEALEYARRYGLITWKQYESARKGLETRKKLITTYQEQYIVTYTENGVEKTESFTSKDDAERFVENRQEQVMRDIGWTGTWKELENYAKEQEKRVKAQEAKVEAIKQLSPIEQLFAGLGAVPYASFVAPFKGELPPATPLAGLIGVVKGGRRSPIWEKGRAEAIAYGEKTRKQLAELGASYIAGGIIGEIAQAYVIGKTASVIGGKVATAIGKKLPYTWQIKLNLKPSPILSLEQGTGTSASESFSFLSKTKGGWSYVNIAPAKPTAETFAPLKTRGVPTTPMSRTLEKVVGSGAKTAVVQKVIQQEATNLATVLAEASDVKIVSMTVPVTVRGLDVKTETVKVPVYEIKPWKISDVQRAINDSSMKLRNVVYLVKSPTVQRYSMALPKLDAKTLQQLTPVLDEEVLEESFSKLDVETLVKLTPLLRESTLKKAVPKLKREQLPYVLPLLKPDVFTSVLPQLDIDEIAKAIPQLGSVQLSKVVQQLNPEQISELVQELTPDQVQKIIPFIPPKQIQRVIQVSKPSIQLKLLKLFPKDFVRRLKKVQNSRFLEPYKVTFQYYMSRESHKVKARSFREALRNGYRLKKKRDDPSLVEVEKLEVRR